MIPRAKYLLALLILVTCAAQGQNPPKVFDRIQVYWKARDYAKAVEVLQQVLVEARKSGSLDDRYEALSWLCTAYMQLGATDKAIATCDERLTLLRANRPHFVKSLFPWNTPGGNDAFAHAEAEILERLGLIYSAVGNHARALQDLHQSVTNLKALPPSGAGLSNALRSLGIAQYRAGDFPGAEKTLREALDSRRTQYDLAVNASGSIAEGDVEILRWIERSLIAQKRTDEALEIAQTSRAGDLGMELLSRYGPGTRNSLRPLSLEQIKTLARTERSTLVEYSIAYEMNPMLQLQFSNYQDIPAAAVYIWVIAPGGQIAFRQVTFEKHPLALAQLVGTARASIGVRGLVALDSASQNSAQKSSAQAPPASASGPQSKQVLQELYEVLITPIESLLPGDPAERVIFVPQDMLYIVPFAALRDPAGNYLIQKHTLATEISMETLVLERKRFDALPSSAGAALVVGNPKMPPGVPQLPGAELEARAIAGLLGADALTGPRATKAAVLQRAANSRIVHLATHGLLDGSEQLKSSMILAPEGADSGFWPAREIGNLKLDTEMAVLSACNTGQGKLTGDGVVGLARSFVEAGVPSIVVSLWSIPDASTSAFMVDFYKGLRTGQDKAQSLRNAMLSTMKQYPEPIAWAAFILIGVPEASATLKAVHGNPRQVVSQVASFTFPVPPGVTNYSETLNPATKEITYIGFETTMSRQDLIRFYSVALALQGLTDDGQLFVAQRGTFFSKKFHDFPRNRDVEVVGNDRAGNLTVRVQFEKAP